ncbi:MAG: hypothetical protein AMS21_12275 [Gemmatimonas sp. SG8_38_2]|nr:MAG: hypothetical protein AMS21_12275 [Gemmatimonas sp. SG8_38_2]
MRGHRCCSVASLLLAGVFAVGCEDVTQVVDDATEFRTTISASSLILDTTGDTLVGDTVQFGVTVTRDGELFRTSEPRFVSSDSQIVRILDPVTGAAVFDSVGRAVVSVTFAESQFPDTLLRAAMTVPVDSLSVSLSMLSNFVVSGDTLVGDTVQFNPVIKRRDGRIVENVLALFASSDTAVIRFVDTSAGLAVLTGPGTAQVTVTFLAPIVPGAPLTAQIPIKVTDFALMLSVESVSSGLIEEGDTLASDSVRFSVLARKDDDTLSVNGATFVSSDASVVNILDPASGRAVLVDTGTAIVTVSHADPDLPNRSASQTLRVATYRVDIGGPISPVMGDEIQYTATVTNTASGEQVGTSGQRFSSSDPSVLEVLDSRDGDMFVRDLGSAQIRVTFDRPSLPYSDVEGTFGVAITEERFYGSTNRDKGDFGDDVRLNSSPVHGFTPDTWVEFPNGTVGFVEQVTQGRLDFVVPAGASSGQLLLHNLADEDGLPRGDVLSHWSFEAEGSVNDEFEPNDRLPLDNDVRIRSVPWVELLSSDPAKSAPADTNFFWFRTNYSTSFDFIATWQADADLDFKVCVGKKQPPEEYELDNNGQPICARYPGENSRDRDKEEALNLFLGRGTWILAYYCVDCPDVPLTYQAYFAWRYGGLQLGSPVEP